MTAMKKIFYLMSVCALAFISCQKEEMAGNDPVEGNYTYEFVAYQQPEAKATIGDKVDGKWPVLWAKGDQMGVYKADGTFVGVATLNEASAGQNKGDFTVSSDVELTTGDALYFSYPYVENAAISTGMIAAKQTVGTTGVGANAVAYAEVEYNPENTQFVLTHTNAYIKFNVKSEEFAGYNLTGVTLWADGAELSGEVTVNDKLTVTKAGDYVKSTLATPVTVSGSEAQSVWVTALPGDLSGKTVYAIVHMTGAEGTEHATETVTLPVKFNKAGALVSGSVTEISLPSLTKSLAPAWYEPIETRYIAAYGDGWCYGPENTILFSAKNAAETVELKARGNFMEVREPKYVQILYATDQTGKTTGYVKFDGTDSHNGTAFIEHEIGNDYSVSVAIASMYNATANGQFSAMLVKDKDKEVIWGINLWACFNPLKTVKYDNGEILTWNLGAGNDIKTYNDWKSHGCYFQWGRPWGFPWSTTVKTYGHVYAATSNQVDLAMSASTPWTMYSYNGEPYDWYWGDGAKADRTGDLDDLWGNPTASGDGVKSIYDPCPQGYRVASPAILKEVEDGIDATIHSETGVITSAEGAATEFNTSGSIYYLSHKGATWGFAGGFQNSSGKHGRLSTNKTDAAVYWSNAISGNQARAMWIRKKSTDGEYSIERLTGRSRAVGATVRCMVDTEDR